ncbi:MAG: type II secretion system protein [Cellvibrionaceae bacterium]|nr:type II secretion system protein [Cellvibrionaceae bacterium]
MNNTMRAKLSNIQPAKGFTLLELVVLIVVLATVMGALTLSFSRSASNSISPIEQSRALQCAKAKLDEISLRPFANNTPVGGLPACGSGQAGAQACAPIVSSSGLDDVGDYHRQLDNSARACQIEVEVTEGGGFAVSGASGGGQLRLISVTARSGRAEVTLASYRGNY